MLQVEAIRGTYIYIVCVCTSTASYIKRRLFSINMTC